MKKFLLFLCVICSLFTFTKCNNLYHSESEKIDLNNSSELFEIFPDTTNFDFTDNGNGDIPGMITKLIVQRDTLFVLDGYKSKSLFVYNKFGELLYNYNHFGEGPDEYIFLADMAIDNNQIYLLDAEFRKVLILNKNGLFIGSRNIPHLTSHILPINDGSTFLCDMNSYSTSRLLMYSQQNIDTLQITPKGMENFNYSPQNVFHYNSYSSERLYMPSYSPVIYEITEKYELKQYMTIDFNGILPNLKVFESLKGKTTNDKYDLITNDYAYYFNFNSNSKHILIDFTYKDNRYFCFVNKNDSKINIFHTSSCYSALALTEEFLYLRNNLDNKLLLLKIHKS